MSEQQAIDTAPLPRTRESLAADFRQLGVQPGMVLLVHSSLSSLGWVNGGAVVVIQALMDVLTTDGTLVMPTHSADYSDPAAWQNPPVPESWHQLIRDTMPAYEPQLTPTRGMGRIPESFRTWSDVHRSSHPAVSFAAWGKHAVTVTDSHTLDNSLGQGSPLARVHELDGYVLLLGVGYDRNTSFHLAEYLAPGRKEITCGAPVMEAGSRLWKTYIDIEFNDDLFPQLGADFEQSFPVSTAQVGSARCRLFSQRQAIDYAVGWLTKRNAS